MDGVDPTRATRPGSRLHQNNAGRELFVTGLADLGTVVLSAFRTPCWPGTRWPDTNTAKWRVFTRTTRRSNQPNASAAACMTDRSTASGDGARSTRSTGSACHRSPRSRSHWPRRSAARRAVIKSSSYRWQTPLAADQGGGRTVCPCVTSAGRERPLLPLRARCVRQHLAWGRWSAGRRALSRIRSWAPSARWSRALCLGLGPVAYRRHAVGQSGRGQPAVPDDRMRPGSCAGCRGGWLRCARHLVR
jgi:hypothetical protein